MAASMETVLAYTALPVGATVLGGVIATFRPPGPTLRSSIQHFAAGVVFAVVAVELLPDIRKGHWPVEVAVTFTLGVASMLLIRRLTRQGKKKEGTGNGWPWGLLTGVGVDVLLDGLLLGIGFAAGAKVGTLLAIALAAEALSLGLATSATMRAGGAERWKSVVASLGLGTLFAVGAIVGGSLLQGLPGHTLAGVLSFGCAALLFLVTEELLVEAHEVPEQPVATVMFFVGFLLFLILGMLE